MSLHLEFEPHSWYMGFAIEDNRAKAARSFLAVERWFAYIDNGNTYRVDELYAMTLDDLKQQIRRYHLKQHNGYGEQIAKRRLEQIRAAIQKRSLSYGEISELQSLADYIDAGDVELLEWAGLPEFEA